MSLADLTKLLEVGENRRIEFKRQLTSEDLINERRKQKLVAQLKYITAEDEGIFLVGVEDLHGDMWKVHGLTQGEIAAAEGTLGELCKEAELEITEKELFKAKEGFVEKFVLVRKAVIVETEETIGINIAGRVNAGKSTLIGVLTGGELDDGRGKARAPLLKHPQELEGGQTADLHVTFLGFDEKSQPMLTRRPTDMEEISRVLEQSKRLILFYDAPGHSIYVKTMIRSILGADAQFAMILIPALDEFELILSEEIRSKLTRLDDITREHLLLLTGQNIPFMVVISRTDLASREQLAKVVEVTRDTLRSTGRVPLLIKNGADLELACREISRNILVPMFEVSAVTGEGVEALRKTLSLLPSRISNEVLQKPALAYIDKIYRGIRGTNVVVTGSVRQGIFKPGQKVKVGPDSQGKFNEGRIATVEVFKSRVERVKAGDSFGFDIKRVDPTAVRRGQVISDVDINLSPTQIFEADIIVTRHPTRIVEGYSPVLQCNTIHQTVVLERIYGKKYLVVGDAARVRFKFTRQPEYLMTGDRVVTREASTRTIGTITEIIQ
nr:GTP-binding protein [Candidatus Njordarchaeota archaeon]